jgi:aminoglycoside 3-N-acetyltransferase
MSEKDTIDYDCNIPVTIETLVADLKRGGVHSGQVLLVHSSLKSLGWVCGGAQAVVLAVEEAIGLDGTLVMPAHTGGLSDPANWRKPPVPESWWGTIRRTMPAYDPDLTPTRLMGAVAECFRKQPGAIRSSHPHSSFAARGPQAKTICDNHGLAMSMGDRSPLARVYDLNGHVLLLGVGFDVNTSFHLAETRAQWPSRAEQETTAPINVNGRCQWVRFKEIVYNDDDFAQIGLDFENQCNAVTRVKVGAAIALYFSQRAAVDFAIKWIEKHRH